MKAIRTNLWRDSHFPICFFKLKSCSQSISATSSTRFAYELQSSKNLCHSSPLTKVINKWLRHSQSHFLGSFLCCDFLGYGPLCISSNSGYLQKNCKWTDLYDICLIFSFCPLHNFPADIHLPTPQSLCITSNYSCFSPFMGLMSQPFFFPHVPPYETSPTKVQWIIKIWCLLSYLMRKKYIQIKKYYQYDF